MRKYGKWMFFIRIEKWFAKSCQQVFSPKYILVVVARWIFSASCCQRKNLFPCQRCTEGRSSKLNAQKGGAARRTVFFWKPRAETGTDTDRVRKQKQKEEQQEDRAFYKTERDWVTLVLGPFCKTQGKLNRLIFSNKNYRPSFRFWVQYSFHNIYRENYPVLSLDM